MTLIDPVATAEEMLPGRGPAQAATEGTAAARAIGDVPVPIGEPDDDEGYDEDEDEDEEEDDDEEPLQLRRS
jgi:hypothetical protein